MSFDLLILKNEITQVTETSVSLKNEITQGPRPVCLHLTAFIPFQQ